MTTHADTTVARSTPLEFDELYREHYERLVRALRIAGAADAAEDIAQEAMARTLARWRRVRAGTHPAGYVYTVAFRLLQRQRVRVARDRVGLPARAVPGPEAGSVTSLVVHDALASMPTARRAVAALCIACGWTTDEAAEVLGIAPATVRVQLHRARLDLHRALGEPEPSLTPR